MKKKVLYISNIEVPYRTLFFNELSKKCNLTVLYERRKSSNRNDKWVSSQKSNFNIEYLDKIKVKNEFSFSFKIRKYVLDDYDFIIFGCCNSLVQIYAMFLLRIYKKSFFINVDGEYFLEGNSFKSKIKRFFIKGAKGYLVAGEKSSNKLKKVLNTDNVYPYYFSSLTKKELKINSQNYLDNNKENYILVVGQFFDYKGLDIALNVAEKLPDIKFKFVGMSSRANLFEQLVKSKNVKNVEIIPFLEKELLYDEYKKCKMLLLTSRRECWGLVINEAASFGCPILASKYAGAAFELLSDKYDEFLFDPFQIEEIIQKIVMLYDYKHIDEYKKYLISKSLKYSIDVNVDNYFRIINNN